MENKLSPKFDIHSAHTTKDSYILCVAKRISVINHREVNTPKGSCKKHPEGGFGRKWGWVGILRPQGGDLA